MIDDIHVKRLENNDYEIIRTTNNKHKIGDILTTKELEDIKEGNIPGTKISYSYK